jgi:hypothetical protein
MKPTIRPPKPPQDQATRELVASLSSRRSRKQKLQAQDDSTRIQRLFELAERVGLSKAWVLCEFAQEACRVTVEFPGWNGDLKLVSIEPFNKGGLDDILRPIEDMLREMANRNLVAAPA